MGLGILCISFKPLVCLHNVSLSMVCQLIRSSFCCFVSQQAAQGTHPASRHHVLNMARGCDTAS
jgi:hypothetical protein